MCGISGFFQTDFNFLEDKKWNYKIEAMKNSLLNRGPDDNDTFISQHTCLGHTRLSIVDIKGGHQPMTRSFKGKTATIIYNGEIYNTKELKNHLSNYDVQVNSSGDTETILNGYLVFGVEIFKYLNGIFSVAIYDHTFDILIIAKDHLGIKPLFYTFDDNIFVFGSEPKALFAYGIKPEADKDTFREIFALGPAHTPGNGVFKDIKEVLPGHFIVLGNRDKIADALNIDYHNLCYSYTHGSSIMINTHYWKLEGRSHNDSYEKTIKTIKSLVTDSVKRQMISEVPIGALLSGGLDSSLISAICSKELRKEGRQLKTFSFDFVDNNKNFKPNSFQSSLDRPYVDIMIDHINSSHTYLECNNQVQIDYLDKAVDARDIPCMADVESSLLYFCGEVAPLCKSVLTGECADEIFGGYPWFHREELMQKEHFPWGYDMNARSIMLDDDFLIDLDIKGYSKKAYEKSLKETPYIDGENDTERRRREIAWLNVRWFMMTLVNRMDRTSMYSGLEARVPFADYRILEYVFNIPWDFKCHEGVTKSLLVEIGKDYLPHEVLYRKKSPYPKTYDQKYENMLKSKLLDVMTDTSSPINSIIDKKKAIKFITMPSDYGKPWYGQLMSGPQMIAYLLQVNYWMKKYKL